MSEILGIDVGGTGLKAGIIDVNEGLLISERVKYATPQPATPEAVAPFIKQLIEDLNYQGENIGVGFPAIIKNQVCQSASNIDKAWLGINIFDYFKETTGKNCYIINDADAAGLAEFNFGHIKNQPGTVIMLTIGTGIGSAIFKNGVLLPNTELGHLMFRNQKAEHVVSNKIRKQNDLSWEEWGRSFNEYLEHLDFVLAPDLIILGGGVSKKIENYKAYFNPDINIISAKHLNIAGLIGAALAAKK